MLRRVVRIVLALALGTVLTTVVMVAPAAAQPTIGGGVGDTATLVAEGVAVSVPFTYTCSPDSTSVSLMMEVLERVRGHHLARGVGGTTNLVCDGIEQVGSVQIPVAANRDETFRVGVGLVMATFSACDATTSCTDFGISKTVQITKAPSLAKG